MNDQVAASEQVAESSGEDLNQGLNPHMGAQVPAEPEGDQEPAKAEDTEGETPPPSEETTEKKPDDDVLQRKVGELAYENRQLRRALEAREAAKAGEAEKPEPLKTLKDFEYDEQAFNEYLIEEGARRGEARARRFQQETTVQTEAERRADEFRAREDAFEADNPGFKERLHAKDLLISDEMAMFITDPASEVGLHVGDFLSKNKTEAARIAGLPVIAQTREMVKLETRIGEELAKAKAEKQKASKAPKPPAGLDGEDPGGVKDPSNPADADKMSDEEWLKLRNKQLEKRRQG